MTYIQRYSLSLLLLLTIARDGWSQGTYVGLNISGGYYVIDEEPLFGGSGYPDQFILQLGALLRVDVGSRISFELAPVYYQTKEQFDCIYFPDGTEPLSNLNPLIDHPVYIGDSSSDTEIQYLDIPLNVYCTIQETEKSRLLFGLGIGPQIQLRRKTIVTDKATGEVLRSGFYDSTQPFLLTWKRYRGLLAYEQAITERIALGSRVEFKTDGLLFSNYTVALGVYSTYRL